MAERFNWKCPFCGHHSTVTEDQDFHWFKLAFDYHNKHGHQTVNVFVIVCPNKDCGEYTLALSISNSPWNEKERDWVSENTPHHRWQLVPESRAQVFPSYIPQPLLDDYREACLICDKSPKASATLSRRCLQGMIRDFWGVKEKRLYHAIEAIKDRVDAGTWEAIDSLRKLGNIGAHMEQDIDLIVEVDPDEAELLIDLLETLFAEWYIARHDREERMSKIKQIAAEKEAARNGEPGTA